MEENAKNRESGTPEAAGMQAVPQAGPVKKKKTKIWDSPALGPVFVLFTAVVFLYLGQSVGQPVETLMQATGNDAIGFAGAYLYFIGIWLVFFLLMLKKNNRPLYRAMGKEAKGNNIRTVLILGLLLGFGYNMTMALLALANGDIRLVFGEFNIGYFLLLLFCVGVQSGAEELVCRLYIYQKLRKLWPDVPAVAVIGNALLFALLHIWNPGVTVLAVLDIAVTGILYSLVVYYFDSFWACVAAHTTWNFTQSILLGLPNSGIVSAYSVFRLDAASAADSPFYTVNFGIEGSLGTVILGIVLCAVLFILGRKRGKKPLDVWKN